MSEATIKSFAAQIGISPDKLLTQLVAAGIDEKLVDDSLSDDEKMTLLTYLRTHHGGSESGTKKITLKQKSVSQIKQNSRTGSARTVQVEVRKKRTFVKRTAIEEAALSEEQPAEPVAETDSVIEDIQQEDIDQTVAVAEEVAVAVAPAPVAGKSAVAAPAATTATKAAEAPAKDAKKPVARPEKHKRARKANAEIGVKPRIAGVPSCTSAMPKSCGANLNLHPRRQYKPACPVSTPLRCRPNG